MEQIFLFVLNNAITVSALIIAIIMVRALGKKMPKWITCMLWIIVAFRLIVPIQIESALSLIPTREPIPANIAMENNPICQPRFRQQRKKCWKFPVSERINLRSTVIDF